MDGNCFDFRSNKGEFREEKRRENFDNGESERGDKFRKKRWCVILEKVT